jgi:hypothetical protein
MNAMRGMLLVVALLLTLSGGRAQQAVYPLGIGDRWQYAGAGWSTPRNVTIFRDSVMLNGQRYSFLQFDYPLGGRWERKAGNQVYRYEPESGQEYLWYDFSLSAGHVVNIIPRQNDSTIIYLSLVGTHQLFGAVRRWWYFWVDYSTSYVDDEEGIQITDSLGFTDMTTMWGFSEIRGAIINGRQYGTITFAQTTEPDKPRSVRLQQNFPNPFNPITTILFETPVAGRVRLSVFDILGREVALLTEGVLPPGDHRVQFDASKLSSGVYFYRLSTPTTSFTKKLIVQK